MTKKVEMLKTLTAVAIAMDADEEVEGRLRGFDYPWEICDNSGCNIDDYEYRKVIKPYAPEKDEEVLFPNELQVRFVCMDKGFYICKVPGGNYIPAKSVSPIEKRDPIQGWVNPVHITKLCNGINDIEVKEIV